MLGVSVEGWSGSSHQQPHRDILATGRSAQHATSASSCLSCSGEAASESEGGKPCKQSARLQGANGQAGRLITSFPSVNTGSELN